NQHFTARKCRLWIPRPAVLRVVPVVTEDEEVSLWHDERAKRRRMRARFAQQYGIGMIAQSFLPVRVVVTAAGRRFAFEIRILQPIPIVLDGLWNSFFHGNFVQIKIAVFVKDSVAGKADNPLDVEERLVLRIFENDDVAALRLAPMEQPAFAEWYAKPVNHL